MNDILLSFSSFREHLLVTLNEWHVFNYLAIPELHLRSHETEKKNFTSILPFQTFFVFH